MDIRPNDYTEIDDKKIHNEEWVILRDIAEVLMPRPLNKLAKVLSPQYFEYPFPKEIPLSSSSTDVILQQGDIIISKTDIDQLFLVNVTPSDVITPSHNTYVIRLHSRLVNPYYLFFYLKSDAVRKYSIRKSDMLYGTDNLKIFNLQMLQHFPIVCPSLLTQKRSFQLFEHLFLGTEDKRIAEINEVLFAHLSLPRKAIQRELIVEVIWYLSHKKRELISKLLVSDFNEMEKCLEVHAYKSCLVICGSILEAVLLDWLSEVEKKDYLESQTEIKLYWITKKLEKFLGPAYLKAENVRKQRNCVHPKVLLTSSMKINESVCHNVINDLKDVLKQRGLSISS